jgi:transcription elongation factor Elf1
MGISFVTRKYICNDCNHHGFVSSAIKNHSDISLYFTEENRPKNISTDRLYVEVLERDEIGIVSKREIVEAVCENCGSSDYTPEVVQRFENVLNFYPLCEAAKWYNGFNK